MQNAASPQSITFFTIEYSPMDNKSGNEVSINRPLRLTVHKGCIDIIHLYI